jgi:hypothetical protein
MKQGQAALEFVSTYGFAFIILLAVLGSLSYFGIFNFSALRSNDCSFPRGITCLDYTMDRADMLFQEPAYPGAVNIVSPGAGMQPYVRVIVYNSYGVNLTVINATYTNDESGVQSCTVAPASIMGARTTNWTAGTNKTLWCKFPQARFRVRDHYDGYVTLNFTQESGTYQYLVKGAVSTTAQ